MTRVDRVWADSISENVNALISEIERLEGIHERVAKILEATRSDADLEFWARSFVERYKPMS